MNKAMHLLLVLVLALVLAVLVDSVKVQAAPTVLVAGDIAIVGFNFDNPDEFAFVLLRDIASGTQITFTDSGWRGFNAFRGGEGTSTWTAGTDTAAGTVVLAPLGSLSLSTAGDQILAFQGAATSPTFIYALNNAGPGVWQPDAWSSNTSALPSGLTDGTTAVALDQMDNAIYTGLKTGTRTQLLAAIGNPANWSGSDSARQTMPTVPFTVQGASPFPACPTATVTAIGAIQGTGATSPVNGQTKTIRGVVTADFQGTNELSGFFVQDGGDGNPNSSDGIFVSSTVAANAGDALQVTGQVNESGSRTRLTQVSSVTKCGPPLTITPITASLPVAATTDLERFEGMLVRFPQTLYVTETFGLGRYGEVGLASERLWQPTNVTTPGAAAIALQQQNDLKRIVLDDGSTMQNPDPIKYPSPGLSAAHTLRAGNTVTGLTGVLDYAAGDYRVHPTVAPTWVQANLRTPNPVVPGAVRVASFNVLNYFNGPTFPTSRGADTPAEFTRQRSKIVNAILAMHADVIGLLELENDGYAADSAIQDLVDGLNASASAGTTYAFVDPGVPQVGTDEITVGILYRVETVEPVGPAAIKEDGPFADQNRPPIAQTFREISTGAVFTVAANHFKSKGSACAGDPDTGDGQGNCNQTRVTAAQELTDWLATDPTGSDDPDVLIVGDLNANAMEDPITAIQNAGYTNLIAAHVGLHSYSFVFMGQSGYLDHALATPSLAAQVDGVLEWHINADEPPVLDYNVEFKSSSQVTSLYSTGPYRSSDHDPVLIGLTLVP